MNTQNVWIKRSEREPTEADLPIVMGGYMCGSGKAWDIALYTCLPPKSHWSGYWRSIKAEPPPRELTQRELDRRLALKLVGRQGNLTEDVLEAIYVERREMNKLLDELWPEKHWGRDESYNSVCKAIRARLDEQGAK